MADQIVVQIPGIEGESQLQGFEKWIEVDSMSLGFTNPSDPSRGSGGSTGGKVQASEIAMTKKTDKASANIFRGVASGKVYDKIVINLLKQTGNKTDAYLTINLTSVMISSYNKSAHGGGIPHESFNLAYTAIEYIYLEQDTKTGKYDKGKTMVKHDVKTGVTS
jgi:type VI secretion system secreted protein Hcp